jgi:LPXTG-motif cell wall-anchored protein
MDFRKHAARLAVLFAAACASAALASPGHASPALTITPGAFCAKNQHGQVQYHDGKPYRCAQDSPGSKYWRWHPVTASQPNPTHTGTGTGSTGTGTNTGSGDRRQGDLLPVTGAGATAAALTGGGLAVAGTGAILVSRRRRRRFVA